MGSSCLGYVSVDLASRLGCRACREISRVREELVVENAPPHPLYNFLNPQNPWKEVVAINKTPVLSKQEAQQGYGHGEKSWI